MPLLVLILAAARSRQSGQPYQACTKYVVQTFSSESHEVVILAVQRSGTAPCPLKLPQERRRNVRPAVRSSPVKMFDQYFCRRSCHRRGLVIWGTV